MPFNLMGLNFDCQMQVLRAWLLSEEAMITRLLNTPPGPILQSSRPEHANALTLVSRDVHSLFESVIQQYQVYELRVGGFSIADSTAPWDGIVPFEKVHYLRLIVEYRAGVGNDCTHSDIPSYTPQLASLIEKFPKLRDVELVVLFDDSHAPDRETDRIGYRGVRGHVLMDMPRTLQGRCELTAIRTSYAGVKWTITAGRTNQDLEYMAKTLKKKTTAGWRVDIKASPMALNPRESLEEAHKLGIRARAYASSSMMSRPFPVGVQPVSDQSGKLVGYRVIEDLANQAIVHPIEDVPEDLRSWHVQNIHAA